LRPSRLRFAELLRLATGVGFTDAKVGVRDRRDARHGDHILAICEVREGADQEVWTAQGHVVCYAE
jgi:hypothetical protein